VTEPRTTTGAGVDFHPGHVARKGVAAQQRIFFARRRGAGQGELLVEALVFAETKLGLDQRASALRLAAVLKRRRFHR